MSRRAGAPAPRFERKVKIGQVLFQGKERPSHKGFGDLFNQPDIHAVLNRDSSLPVGIVFHGFAPIEVVALK